MTGTDSATTEEPPTTNETPVSELAIDFSGASKILFSAGSLEDILVRVLELSVTTVEACEFAGMFLVEEGAVVTSVQSDPIASEVDAFQHDFGEGPSLDAIAQRLTFYSGELGIDPRWPNFGPAAAAKGMRSLLALPLSANGMLGALNLYARYPEAFGVVDRARGLLLATLAGLASAVALAHEDEERRVENLNAALVTRELIGQAQGILIERERITAEQAFTILRQASQHLNIKLREVAQHLVDTGERPDTGGYGSDVTAK